MVASLEQEALWLIMSGVVHRWELTTLLVHVLLEGKGKRTGEASIFYEYVPIPEHFTASLVGHQSARSENKLTYGLYSAGISDTQKREIIDQVRLPQEVLL